MPPVAERGFSCYRLCFHLLFIRPCTYKVPLCILLLSGIEKLQGELPKSKALGLSVLRQSFFHVMRACFPRTHPFQVEAHNSNPERGRTGSNRYSTGEKSAPHAGYQARIMIQAQQTPHHPTMTRNAHSTKKDEKQQTSRRTTQNPTSRNQISLARTPIHARPKPDPGEPNHETPAKTESSCPPLGYCTPHSYHDPPRNRTQDTNTHDQTTIAYQPHGNDARTHDTTESTGRICSHEQDTSHAPTTYDATSQQTSTSHYRT